MSINDSTILAEISGSSDPPRQSNREGFGRGLLEAGQNDERVVALTADVTSSVKANLFADAYPERFINVGIAEQNLISVASGMAAMGKIPFAISYAIFNPGRNWEQIRTTICINQQNVKIIGSHAGLSAAKDGATHQMLEDIALMRALPEMTVIAPADSQEAHLATLAIAKHQGPVYLRLSRDETPLIFSDKTTFSLTRAKLIRRGSDLSIFSTGTMLYQAIVATQKLASEGIDAELLHVPVIKPLDFQTILSSLEKTTAAITVEEGQVAGGFGSTICELTAERCPARIRRVGVKDRYGQSGDAAELLAEYDLTVRDIVAASLDLLGQIGRYHPKGRI